MFRLREEAMEIRRIQELSRLDREHEKIQNEARRNINRWCKY